MTRLIAVGIHSDSSYSAQVLNQLGIPAIPLESLADGIAGGARVFLWNKSCIMSEKPSSEERVAIVTDHTCLGSNTPEKCMPVFRSYYFRLPHNPFSAQSFYVDLPALQVRGTTFGACYDQSNNEIPNSGIGIIEKAGRLIVSLPWDICGYEQGVEWEHRPYFSTPARKHFVEVGPLLDTGAFRRLLLEILLYCFNWVNLPLVRVSPFYKNKRYFSFRIDADGFSKSSTEAGLRVAEKSGLRFTWFLDMRRWKNKKKWIKQLVERNQDVQFHCFRHMTYASQEVNDINIRKGLGVMRRSGVTPNAIVSPMGYNYKGFSEAIKEHGFAYSSEFGYAVDDLPSRPWNKKNYPLQIPVHPGCSGVFQKAGFTERDQFAHLHNQVEKQCECDGICVLYDHPMGGIETHEQQFVKLFEELRRTNYEYICMTDYYRAWIARPHNPKILFDRGRIQVDGFRDTGFRFEQVTNGSTKSVRWENATLPQVSLPGRDEEFRYPSEWIHELARVKILSNSKQRNFCKFAWHANEVYNTLGRYSGYFGCRRLLARVRWLRAVKKGIMQRGNWAQRR